MIIDETNYSLKGKQVKDIANRITANHDAIGDIGGELASKQDALSQAQLDAVNSGIDSTKVGQIATNASDIDSIEAKIPAQATSSNQLADKDFVNSSVATNTANYISNNGEPFTSLAQLEAYSGDLSNNDYAFVVGTDSAGNTTYTRYKYVADTQEWAEEYVLNNSSFTANQWAAINSGITSGDVTKLAGIEAGAEVNDINSISVNGTAVAPDANKNVDILIPDGVLLLDVDNHTLTADELQAFKDAWDSREPIFIHYGAIGGQIVHSLTGNTLDWTQPQSFSAIMQVGNISDKDNPNLQGAQVVFTPSTMNLDFSWNGSSFLAMEGDSSLSTTSNSNSWVKKSAIQTALAGKADNTAFTGTDGSTAGTMGLVPAPATTDSGKVLSASGSWITPDAGIKTLTAADYNWPTSGTKTRLNLGTLEQGIYRIDENGLYNVIFNGRQFQIGGDNDLLIVIGRPNSGSRHFLCASPVMHDIVLIDGQYTNGYSEILAQHDVLDVLTSTSKAPLSANQGKVLKDLIDSIAVRGAGAPTASTVGTVGQLYEDGTNGALYQLKSIDITVTPNTYNWEEVGGSSVNVVQTTGTSTTDVMSQNAVSSAIYADPGTGDKVRIGNGARTPNVSTTAVGKNSYAYGIGSIAIGLAAEAGGEGSIALRGMASGTGAVGIGLGSNATRKGQVDFSTSGADYPTSYGYNNSAYRLLTGLYDPQSAHDATNKQYVDGLIASLEARIAALEGN